jgi:hypothetical protein
MQEVTDADRRQIDEALAEYGAQAGLDETHPPGDPMLAGLFETALIGAEAQSGFDSELAVRTEAARWTAAAILTANFGPDYVAEHL